MKERLIAQCASRLNRLLDLVLVFALIFNPRRVFFFPPVCTFPCPLHLVCAGAAEELLRLHALGAEDQRTISILRQQLRDAQTEASIAKKREAVAQELITRMREQVVALHGRADEMNAFLGELAIVPRPAALPASTSSASLLPPATAAAVASSAARTGSRASSDSMARPRSTSGVRGRDTAPSTRPLSRFASPESLATLESPYPAFADWKAAHGTTTETGEPPRPRTAAHPSLSSSSSSSSSSAATLRGSASLPRLVSPMTRPGTASLAGGSGFPLAGRRGDGGGLAGTSSRAASPVSIPGPR